MTRREWAGIILSTVFLSCYSVPFFVLAYAIWKAASQ